MTFVLFQRALFLPVYVSRYADNTEMLQVMLGLEIFAACVGVLSDSNIIVIYAPEKTQDKEIPHPGYKVWHQLALIFTCLL